jgi:hypothetical protein
MKPLKLGLAGLVVLLAIAVAYGYGCGGGDDKGGSGGATSAAETDGTTNDNAASTESGDGDGDGGSEDGSGDGDGGGDGGGGAPLSKAAYVKQGDAICEKVPLRFSQTLTTLEKESKGKKLSPAEANLKAAVPPLYTAAEELEGLTPPSGQEAKAEAIIDALEGAAKGLEAKPTSELSGPKSPFAEFQKLSKEFGFKACSEL